MSKIYRNRLIFIALGNLDTFLCFELFPKLCRSYVLSRTFGQSFGSLHLVLNVQGSVKREFFTIHWGLTQPRFFGGSVTIVNNEIRSIVIDRAKVQLLSESAVMIIC